MINNINCYDYISSQDSNTSTSQRCSYNFNLMQIQGSLYIKSEKKPIQLLSEFCTLNLLIINEKSFDYAINLKNENKQKWENIQFILNNDFNFSKFVNRSGNMCIMWQKNSTFYIFEFYNDEDKNSNIDKFLQKLNIFLISNFLKISLLEAEESKKDSINNFGQIDELSTFLENNFKNNNNLVPQLNNNNNFITKKNLKSQFKFYKEIYSCKGTAFKYDKYNESLLPLDSNYSTGNSLLKIVDISDNNYILVIEKNENILLYIDIKCENSIVIDENLASMSFITTDINNKNNSIAYSFSFSNKSKDEIHFFQTLIFRCLFGVNLSADKNISFFDYFGSMNKRQSFTNIFSQNYNDIENEFIASPSKIVDIGNYQETKNISYKDNSKNKLILQTYNQNKTFIIKDNNQIDVFKSNDNDDKLLQLKSFNLLNKNYKKEDNKNFQIINAKMFNKDTQILLQSSNNKNNITQFDINSQKVIQEWNCNIPDNNTKNNLINFTYLNKLGQINSQSEILAINKNNILLLDGRVNRKNKIVNFKNFSNSPNFTSIITTGLGCIAIGSYNGDIRLFNEMGNFAKTLIKGNGDEIKFLDTTNDGNYILASCDKYIMLINTKKNFESNGFKECLKKIDNESLILKMTPMDLIKYGVKNECYTEAKFNNSTKNEILIISSLGQYIIMWNFEEVKKGEVNAYKVVNVHEFVIGNTTKFDKNQIIIAMSDKIRVQNEEISID